jgi:hypothetical protein
MRANRPVSLLDHPPSHSSFMQMPSPAHGPHPALVITAGFIRCYDICIAINPAAHVQIEPALAACQIMPRASAP